VHRREPRAHRARFTSEPCTNIRSIIHGQVQLRPVSPREAPARVRNWHPGNRKGPRAALLNGPILVPAEATTWVANAVGGGLGWTDQRSGLQLSARSLPGRRLDRHAVARRKAAHSDARRTLPRHRRRGGRGDTAYDAGCPRRPVARPRRGSASRVPPGVGVGVPAARARQETHTADSAGQMAAEAGDPSSVCADPRPDPLRWIPGNQLLRTLLPSGRVAEYAYVRYFFTNYSADIRRIFCEQCDLLGIHWTQSSFKNISIAHRDSVAILDSFIGRSDERRQRVMRAEGVEPPRSVEHRDLNPARLPVPARPLGLVTTVARARWRF
jgi:hypothetical protein